MLVHEKQGEAGTDGKRPPNKEELAEWKVCELVGHRQSEKEL